MTACMLCPHENVYSKCLFFQDEDKKELFLKAVQAHVKYTQEVRFCLLEEFHSALTVTLPLIESNFEA